MHEIAAELGLIEKGAETWARHPLVLLVEASDDICYAIIDLEDALEVGILLFNQVESVLIMGLNDEERKEFGSILSEDISRRLGYLRGKAVDYLVGQAINAFFENEDKILAGEFDGDLISHCSEEAKGVIKEAKNLAYEQVFNHTRKTQIEIGAYAIMDVLMKSFCDAFLEFRRGGASFRADRVFSLLGVNAPAKDQDLYAALIRITDFVAGSTDRYAMELSRRLSGFGF